MSTNMWSDDIWDTWRDDDKHIPFYVIFDHHSDDHKKTMEEALKKLDVWGRDKSQVILLANETLINKMDFTPYVSGMTRFGPSTMPYDNLMGIPVFDVGLLPCILINRGELVRRAFLNE